MLTWIDVETTGLGLLEVGCIITDFSLNEIARQAWVIQPSLPVDTLIETANEWARKTHTDNGLWDALRVSTTPLAVVEEKLCAFIDDHHADKSLLAGNSVHFDRKWLQLCMPSAERKLHYRNLDISTLKETFRIFSPFDETLLDPPKKGQHRSLGDLDASIAELKHYLDLLNWTLS